LLKITIFHLLDNNLTNKFLIGLSRIHSFGI
jgi:hypothetical protein